MTGFGFLSTYPPTRCGLATFTAALASAIALGDEDSRVVRVDDGLGDPSPAVLGERTVVVATLDPGDPVSARDAARRLNEGDVAIVQHEYGIYGGPDGDEILAVLDALTVPCIVIAHTVLEAPTPSQRRVLEEVADRASVLVVMTHAAEEILARGYRIPESKVVVIPHGVPEWATGVSVARAEIPTVLTWGLIGPGKGIEWGIRAIAAFDGPGARPHYVVAGETHPKVRAQVGEAYRESLQSLITELGVDDDVTLDGRYLDAGELSELVRSSDLVLLPYDSRDQVTSGVLVEAIAAGKPVVATGFPHAVELLTPMVGTIVPHEDPATMSTAIAELLTRTDRPEVAVPAPVASTLKTTWPIVAASYRTIARRLLRERAA